MEKLIDILQIDINKLKNLLCSDQEEITNILDGENPLILSNGKIIIEIGHRKILRKGIFCHLKINQRINDNMEYNICSEFKLFDKIIELLLLYKKCIYCDIMTKEKICINCKTHSIYIPQNDVCSVCLEELSKFPIQPLSCCGKQLHLFCYIKCIDNNFNFKCPLCRNTSHEYSGLFYFNKKPLNNEDYEDYEDDEEDYDEDVEEE